MSTDNTSDGLPTYADGIEQAAKMAALYDTGEAASTALFVTANLARQIAEHPATPAEVEKAARWGICDMDCQPDWHHDECAIYIKKPAPPAEVEGEWVAVGGDPGMPDGYSFVPAEPDAGDVDGLSEAEVESHVCCVKPGRCRDEHFHQRDVERILATRTRMAAEAASQEAWKVAAQRRDEARRFYLAWQVARIRAAAWRRAAEAGEKRGAERALREAAEQAERDAADCPDGCNSPRCTQANLTTADWLRARADREAGR